jgi:hypothetical protein
LPAISFPDIFVSSDSQIRMELSGIMRIVPGILLLNRRTVKNLLHFTLRIP